MLTATTTTGLSVARKEHPDLAVLPSPLDLSCALRRFMRRRKPRALVLVEGELWPNMLACARLSGMPVVLANGKVSQNSARGYRRLMKLRPGFLDPISALALQGEAHRERFESLGVPAGRMEVVGNLKFDNVTLKDPAPERVPSAVRARLSAGRLGPHGRKHP